MHKIVNPRPLHDGVASVVADEEVAAECNTISSHPDYVVDEDSESETFTQAELDDVIS